MTAIGVPLNTLHPRLKRAALTGLCLLAIDCAPPVSAQSSGLAVPAGDGNCFVDIVIDTIPKFTERLPCHYSNFPSDSSTSVYWTVPKSPGGLVVSLATGQKTANFAKIAVHTVLIEYLDGNGNKAVIPKPNYLYALNATSKNSWDGVVDVFPDGNVLNFIECQGGYYGNALPPRPYLAGTDVKFLWTSVQDFKIIDGTVQAVLTCFKVNLKGPRTPLGAIGKVSIKF